MSYVCSYSIIFCCSMHKLEWCTIIIQWNLPITDRLVLNHPLSTIWRLSFTHGFCVNNLSTASSVLAAGMCDAKGFWVATILATTLTSYGRCNMTQTYSRLLRNSTLASKMPHTHGHWKLLHISMHYLRYRALR